MQYYRKRPPAPVRREPERRRRRKYKIKKRFFVFLAAALVVCICLIWGAVKLVQSLFSGVYEVDYGMLEGTNTVSALLVRKEEVVRADSFGTVDYIVPDGQDVAEGAPVLNLYSSGLTSEITSQLQQVRERIAQQQEDGLLKKLKDIVDTDLASFDADIATVCGEIEAAMESDPGSLPKLEDKLSALMADKQKYLAQTSAAREDATLAQLYATEAQLLSRIEGWKTSYSAPEAGRVSYYTDGLEPFLTVDTLESLKVANVQSLMKDVDPGVPEELRTKQFLYRLVDPMEWYVIILTNDKDWRLGPGEKCALYFEKVEDITYQGTVLQHQGNADDLLVALKMEGDIGPLLNARRLNAVIGGRVEGMRVPLGSVQTVDGQQGVYLVDGKFVPVRVVGHDSKYALVMPVNDGELDKGMRVKK